MLDFLFLLVFFSAPIAIFSLLRLSGEKINQVSIINVTVVALYLFSVLGVFVLYFQFDQYRYATGIVEKELVFQVFLYSCLNITLFLFGVITVRKLIGVGVYPISVDEIKALSKFQVAFLGFLFLFCCLVLVRYLSYIDRVAIVVALTDGVSEAKLARSEMGNAFPGKFHWYKLVMYDVGAVLTFTCFAMWLLNKNKLVLLSFVVVFSYSCFISIMAIEKAPLAWLMVGLFMTYFLVKNRGFIPIRLLIPFSLLIVGLLVLLYIFFMGSRDIGAAIWSVFSRSFSGSISPAYFYLEYFPEHQSYLQGRTFPNPGGIMPYSPYNYTVEVMNWKFPKLVDKGIVGSAPTVFWGEAYVNFGYLGVAPVAFFMGCMLAVISAVVSRVELNPLVLGYLVWLILLFKDLSITGFSGYIFNLYFIVISIIIFFVLLLKGGKIKLKS